MNLSSSVRLLVFLSLFESVIIIFNTREFRLKLVVNGIINLELFFSLADQHKILIAV